MFRFGTLRTRLVVFLLALSVPPFAALGLTAITHSREVLERTIGDHLAGLALGVGLTLERSGLTQPERVAEPAAETPEAPEPPLPGQDILQRALGTTRDDPDSMLAYVFELRDASFWELACDMADELRARHPDAVAAVVRAACEKARALLALGREREAWKALDEVAAAYAGDDRPAWHEGQSVEEVVSWQRQSIRSDYLVGQGRYAAAADLGAQARQLYESVTTARLGHPLKPEFGLALWLVDIGDLHSYAGDWERAGIAYKSALDYLQAHPEWRDDHDPTYDERLRRLPMEIADCQSPQAPPGSAIELRREVDRRIRLGTVLHGRVRNNKRAAEEFRRALTYLEQHPDLPVDTEEQQRYAELRHRGLPEELNTTFDRSRLVVANRSKWLADTGEYDQAVRCCEEWLEHFGGWANTARVRGWLADVYFRAGDQESGQRALQEAREAAEELPEDEREYVLVRLRELEEEHVERE